MKKASLDSSDSSGCGVNVLLPNFASRLSERMYTSLYASYCRVVADGDMLFCFLDLNTSSFSTVSMVSRVQLLKGGLFNLKSAHARDVGPLKCKI